MRESQVRMYWFILLAATAFAQDTGSVRGTVVSATTGEPLRKAVVNLQSVPAKFDGRVLESMTDSSGTFAFDAVPAGNYVALARRNGYLESGSKARGVTVQKDQSIADLVLKLTPQSVVTGKVVDEDGDPMQSVAVHLMREAYLRGRRTYNQTFSAQTNDLGEYRIPGLRPGRYLLMADPPQVVGKPAGPSYVPTYAAAPVEMTPGQELRGADIRLRKTQTQTLKGRVVDVSGAPIRSGSLFLSIVDSPSTPAERAISIGPDGVFTLMNLPPGSYMLQGSGTDPKGGRLSGSMPIRVSEREAEDVVLRLAAAGQVSGVVRASEGAVDLRAVRVILDPLDEFPLDMQSSRTLGDGGAFTVPDVVPARYAVDVFGAPEGYYVQSVQWSGQDVTESGITVSGDVPGLDVVLTKGAANVEGSVDTPLAIVVVVPPSNKRQRWTLYKTAMAGATGRFTVRNLPPGEYTVAAFPPGTDTSILQNPEVLNQIGSRAVTVKPGSEPVELKVVE
jgi:protocatechuate 3,4-dioxygenase beta subunit